MHHAAMSGKKDTMFALAQLGCHWWAQADGIKGATAAYVLLGQHGRNSRQTVRAVICGAVMCVSTAQAPPAGRPVSCPGGAPACSAPGRWLCRQRSQRRTHLAGGICNLLPHAWLDRAGGA